MKKIKINSNAGFTNSGFTNSGFTIVEMMVVTGVMGILMVGFGAYLYQQTQQTKNHEKKVGINQLKDSTLDEAGKADTLLRAESALIQETNVYPNATTSPGGANPN